MKSKIMLLVFVFVGLLFAAGELTTTSSSSPVGKRGLIYKSRSVFLVGDGSFWLLNDPYYYQSDGSTHLTHLRTHLDAYKPPSPNGKALGVIRVSAIGTPVRYSGVDHSKKRYPFRRVSGQGTARDGGNKFDCTQWDSDFFAHLKTLASEAETRGIVLGIILWDEIPLERGSNNTRWAHNPFEPANNVNNFGLPSFSSGADGLPQFYNKPLDGSSQGNALRDAQDAMVRKFCAELKGVPNVFFFISNECTGSSSWRDRQIQTIKSYNSANNTQFISVTMNWGSGASSISDGVSPSTHSDGTGWRSDGRPEIAQRDRSGANARQTFWTRFIQGAASAGARDDYSGNTPPATMYTSAASEDQQLRRFVNSITSDMDRLVRDDSPFSSGWKGRKNPGVEYVAWKSGSSTSISVNLSGENGLWRLYEWNPTSSSAGSDRGTKPAGNSVTWTVRSGECGVVIVKEGTTELRNRPVREGYGIKTIPNPFTTSVQIDLLMQNAKCKLQIAKLRIFDMSGRQVHESPATGRQSLAWNGGKNPGGIYIIKARIADRTYTAKTVLRR
jgi:hypothetical protein